MRFGSLVAVCLSYVAQIKHIRAFRRTVQTMCVCELEDSLCANAILQPFLVSASRPKHPVLCEACCGRGNGCSYLSAGLRVKFLGTLLLGSLVATASGARFQIHSRISTQAQWTLRPHIHSNVWTFTPVRLNRQHVDALPLDGIRDAPAQWTAKIFF